MTKGTTNIPVVNVILRKDDKVLFLLRKNTGWMDGYYALPSGHVDPGENFRQAACRELKEEVGIEITPAQLQHRLTFHQVSENAVRVCIYFEAMDWSGEPYNAEPEVHEEIAWLDLENLPNTVIPTTRKKFELIKNGQIYSEHGWEDEL